MKVSQVAERTAECGQQLSAEHVSDIFIGSSTQKTERIQESFFEHFETNFRMKIDHRMG